MAIKESEKGTVLDVLSDKVRGHSGELVLLIHQHNSNTRDYGHGMLISHAAVNLKLSFLNSDKVTKEKREFPEPFNYTLEGYSLDTINYVVKDMYNYGWTLENDSLFLRDYFPWMLIPSPFGLGYIEDLKDKDEKWLQHNFYDKFNGDLLKFSTSEIESYFTRLRGDGLDELILSTILNESDGESIYNHYMDPFYVRAMDLIGKRELVSEEYREYFNKLITTVPHLIYNKIGVGGIKSSGWPKTYDFIDLARNLGLHELDVPLGRFEIPCNRYFSKWFERFEMDVTKQTARKINSLT